VNRRLALLFFGFALFAAACTSEGLPADFADQDRRTETQFVNACESSLADGENDLGDGYCTCAFRTVALDLGFEGFLDLDQQLRDDPTRLSLEQRELIQDISLPCEFSDADVYG